MDRKTYDKQVTDIANNFLNGDLDARYYAIIAINNVLIAEGIDIPQPEPKPVSEQKWHYEEGGIEKLEVHNSTLYGIGKWIIKDEEGNVIAKAYGEEMRDILCGIPKLIKACLEQGIIYNSISDALKAMGLIDSG